MNKLIFILAIWLIKVTSYGGEVTFIGEFLNTMLKSQLMETVFFEISKELPFDSIISLHGNQQNQSTVITKRKNNIEFIIFYQPDMDVEHNLNLIKREMLVTLAKVLDKYIYRNNEEEELKNCRDIDKSQGTFGIDQRCEYLRNLGSRFSNRDDFIILNNFLTPEKNKLLTSFKHNFTNFILDPIYACKKPSFHHYFTKIFKLNYVPMNCDPSEINNNKQHQINALKNASIYGVELLYVTPGKDIMSKWGHTMLNFIVCNPGRKEISKDCVNDRKYHIVASIHEESKKPFLDGITGNSKLIFDLYSFPQVDIGYRRIEKRKIHGVRLNLDHDELINLVDLYIELASNGKSSWNHITQNCSATTLSVLKIAVKDDKYYRIDDLTPRILIESMSQYENLASDIYSI